jgi:tRNA pseudouridine38-40 synthase
MQIKYYYLINIQYLGFRFHGWQKQEGLKTVHSMIDRTVKFILKHDDFKTLGTSRTDAMVSANHSAFELFMNTPIDEESFVDDMNLYLPSDIKIMSIEQVDKTFNIINTPRIKEYIYLFSFGQKNHPFTASIMESFTFDLDLELMKEGAKLFQGEHNFRKYCTKPSEKTKFKREILVSEIVENDIFSANFFPEKSYVFKVSSEGFMRNQVRLMMGQLFELGKGNITLDDLKNSIAEDADTSHFKYIASASGLTLYNVKFLEKK